MAGAPAWATIESATAVLSWERLAIEFGGVFGGRRGDEFEEVGVGEDRGEAKHLVAHLDGFVAREQEHQVVRRRVHRADFLGDGAANAAGLVLRQGGQRFHDVTGRGALSGAVEFGQQACDAATQKGAHAVVFVGGEDGVDFGEAAAVDGYGGADEDVRVLRQFAQRLHGRVGAHGQADPDGGGHRGG